MPLLAVLLGMGLDLCIFSFSFSRQRCGNPWVIAEVGVRSVLHMVSILTPSCQKESSSDLGLFMTDLSCLRGTLIHILTGLGGGNTGLVTFHA